MTGKESPSRTAVRALALDDLDDVVRIDALHTGQSQPEYWRRVFRLFLGPEDRGHAYGFGVEDGGRLAGYLFGEIRAVEFGSGPCGWIFAIGIDRGSARQGLATALLEAACRTFREAGVSTIRTMVRRNDVPVLSFFRASGFVGGPYVQLELDGEVRG